MVPNFRPEEGKYLVSVWAKVQSESYLTNYEAPYIRVAGKRLDPSGPMVEGWQKIEGVVDLNSTDGVQIKFCKDSSHPLKHVYFDDFRMHPIDANMKAYVYDHNDYRFMAELDENNFAVFYEYDEEGSLIRTKRETERGVVTINENRKHVQKD